MTDAMKSEVKRQRVGRSPSYPSIPLATALEKARAQYDTEGKYPVPLQSAFRAWGYSDKSSGGRDVRASLRYFGLVTIDGDGDLAKVKLTEDALRVLLDEREDQTEKRAIIRRLALNPSAHKKLWAKFPDGIKSDATASHYLVFEEGFNTAAAAALIAEFKVTADFAGLYEPDTVSVIQEPEMAHDDQNGDAPLRESSSERLDQGRSKGEPHSKGFEMASGERELQSGMLSKGAGYRVIVSGQIGVKEIERLIKKLEMDKEILADDDTPDDLKELLG